MTAAEQLAGLSREQKLALLARLAEQRAPRAYPLSFAQQRLWFLDRFEPGGYGHNIFRALELEGSLDRDAFERALSEILRRHAALRAAFSEVDGEPRQLVAGAEEAPALLRRSLIVADLRRLPSSECRRQVRELADQEARRAFDLTRAPLLRLSLLRTGEHHHALLVTFHHIVADGWSLGLFFHELSSLYRSLLNGQPLSLPGLPIQYTDFAHWQQEELDLAPQLDYWRRELEGAPGVLELPTDRLRPAVASARGAIHPFSLPRPLYQSVKTLAREAGATPFMLLLAVFDALLYRYSGQEDFLIGTPIANRHRAEVEGLIGCFANTLVLRAELDQRITFRQLLAQVRRRALAAYGHQDLPFERLVEELQPQRDPSRNPLFQVMFALQNTPASRLRLPGLTPRAFDVEQHLSKVDLTLEMSELGDRLDGYFEYNVDLFERPTIHWLADHLQVLLQAMVADPDCPISQQPLLTRHDRHRLLTVWSRSPGRRAVAEPIHRLIEGRAAATPDAIAVVDPEPTGGVERSLSFGRLDRQAERVARALRRRGVAAESRVGIAIARSLEAVVAILGTLKAGAAYVSLDPTYPRERLDYVRNDAGVGVVLTRESLIEVLCERVPGELDVGEPPVPGLEAAAYVVYTSGSTGRPKGVMVAHRAVCHHALAIIDRYRLEATDRVLQFASLSFDISVEELFPTLLAGAALILRPNALSLTFHEFFGFVEEQRLNVLNLPTPYWHEWVSELSGGRVAVPPALRLVVVGTEAVLPERLRTWRRVLGEHRAGHRLHWINAYGPSEATVTTTAYGSMQRREPADSTPDSSESQHVPIGRPIGNVRAYILNHSLDPVPAKVSGYLHLGGPGLARGYQGRPALTAEKFVPDPYSDRPGSRVYNTGDVSRWLTDGNIEFLGRVDQQVKIRGFRVELGEIEVVLSGHPAVKEAVVVAPEVAPGERRLAVYLVPEAPPSSAPEAPAHEITAGSRQLIDELQDYAHRNLPDYMVPAAFAVLDHLPLTTSGKVDRRALPDPSWTAVAHSGPFAAPRTPQQELLADLWARVLDSRRRIGVDENFFELGGHSLLATRVLSRVRDLLDVDLPIRALFEAPTIAGLSERVDAARRRGSGTLPPPIRSSSASEASAPPLSFAQQRMWFLDQLEPGSAAYNMPVALGLRGELETAPLERALTEILRRHDSLRTNFRSADGRPTQQILPPMAAELAVIQIDGASLRERRSAALALAREESLRPFDLERGPLLRTVLLRLDPRDHLLVFTMHHIVSDGWSVDVFLRELVRLYDAYRRRQPSPLPELPIQYVDFARWQRRWLEGEVLEGQLAYWRQQLAGAPAVLELPLDRPRPPVQRFCGARSPIRLDPELGSELRSLARRLKVTPFMLLAGAFGVLLHRYCKQQQVLVGTPVAGRQRPELDDLIGFFVNTLVLRMDLVGDGGFETFMERVREAALDAYSHQDVPFEQLVEELRPVREMSHNPIFQVLFVLHQARSGGQALEGLELTLPSIDNRTSRFDLTLSMIDTGEGFVGFLEYNVDLFDATTAGRMARHFRHLLAAVAGSPQRRIRDLTGLAATERQQLLVEWSDTGASYARTAPIHQLFEAQAERTPDAAAVIFGREVMSYGELNRRANRLAHRLRRDGVCREDLVAIHLRRSPRLLVAILGVLKASAAYVPLEPSLPPQRLAFLLRETRSPLVLTETALESQVTAPALPRLCLDAVESQLAGEPDGDSPSVSLRENPGTEVRGDQLAYVLYTSGSTGLPKGVMVPHCGLVNYLCWAVKTYTVAASGGAPVHSPLGFDLTVTSLWTPLLTGRSVFLPDEAPGIEPLLQALSHARGFSLLKLTPATLDLLAHGLNETDGTLPPAVVVGGEALAWGSLETWRERSAATRWFNEYGPTETVVGCSVYRTTAGDAAGSEAVPIGRPIANTRIYVVDGLGRPVAAGVVGELLVGGRGVARGYLGRPRLTAERFVPDPFGGVAGERLYRTGDLARHLGDGNLEFKGRVDRQVKIRGFRIEPGEVEAVLSRQAGVRECVVVVRRDRPGDERLVAYLTAGETPAGERPVVSELRAALARKLPDYMVPADFVFLEALALDPNGKIDRKALPAPERDRSALESTFVPPRTPIEERLTEIWEVVLGRDEIGVHDSFFELGGHSLLAAQVRARVLEGFGVELPLRRFFESPTVASLAEDIVEREVADADQDLLAELLADLEEPVTH